ncbi:MAG: GNAT family N-acetyltransferase, partial [Acidimicrobiia bacterium]
MKTLKIEEVVARDANDEQLAEISALDRIVEAEIRPNDPPQPAEEFIAWTRAEPDSGQLRYWVARDGSSVSGFSWIEYEWAEGNPHLAFAGVEVHPDSRRSGFGRKLLEPVVAAAKADGKTLLTSAVSDLTPGPKFAESLGAKFAQRERESRLVISEIDVGLLDGWIERASERASDYSLIRWDGPTSPELLPGFAKVMAAMNDAPMPENWNDFEYSPERISEWETRQGKAGFTFWTVAAGENETGEIGGYTRLYPNPWRPMLAHQDDTGVLPEHRNKGLGRWVKAEMMKRLMRELPEVKFVTTENASTNKAMLGINVAMG